MAIRTPAHIVQPAIVLLGALACILLNRTTESATAVTPTQISQVPLTVAQLAHPQVVIALGNSESMDGNLSGAIMTGSGSLPAAMALLENSSSPAQYTIPAGFTPPVDPGNGVTAPYTSKSGGLLLDNSPSRLNVAKAGITATLNNFMAYADFALVTYDLGGTNIYTTWVYEMSPPGGFAFTSTPIAGARYITNPCYQYSTLGAGNSVYVACHNIDISGQVTGSMNTSTLMQVDATQFPATAYNGGSSDDPLINDVLYAGGLAPVCLVYGGPLPGNPYTSFKLSAYNANPGNIHESYQHTINACAPTTFPTNAGFVPYTPQTMYIERGFGYYGGQSATQGSTLVNMTTAGALPTTASVNAAIAKFTPFLAPETNSPGTTEIKAAGGQSALPGLLQQAITIFNGKPAGNNGCPPDQYVILLTDGLPTLAKGGSSWPPPGTVSAQNWNMTPGIYGGKTVGFITAQNVGVGQTVGQLDFKATTDQAVKDTVTQLQTLFNGTGHVKTYVIGLGAGVDPTVNPVAANVLTAFAIAGGTGAYFPATDQTSLVNALQTILTQVMATTQSTSSTAVNSTGLNLNSVAYLAQFNTSDTYQDWTGNLNAWPINPITGAVPTSGTPNWSAQTQLDAQNWDTGRLIATWDPVANAGTPFRWNPALVPAGISATTGLGKALSTFAQDPNGMDVVNYLRGNSALELRNATSTSNGQFRNRSHTLGDIVDSAPIYIGAPNGLAQTSDYFAFAKQYQNRRQVIYVGANDGMLHAFDPATGNELFAYIPNGVFNNLIKLVSPLYNDNHQFFVNGSPRSADVKFASTGTWHTVLVGNLGAGGSTLFALDVTDPGAIIAGGEPALAQAALWEFSDTDMGLSFSEPAIADTAAGWMVFFGNGYNSPNQKPVLYAVDPQCGGRAGCTGAAQVKIDLCAQVTGVCNAALPNGLSSVTAVNSYGQVSAPANTVYAGDLQGNVWRVDITNSNPASWVVSVIFQTRDSLGNIQPITTVPAVTLNPQFPQLLGTMVFVGTGQMLGVGDLSTTGIQSMYGIFDPPTGSTGIPTRSNLVQQFLCADTTSDNVPVRDITGVVKNGATPVQADCSKPMAAAQIQLPQNRGWFVDLALYSGGTQTNPGERIITDPEIESGGGVVFTTYQPNPSLCQGGGSAWLMVLNYATGAAFPLPELDTNSDGTLDGKDRGTAQGNPVPVGMSLGPVYASAPTLLPGGGGIGGTMKLTSVSSNNVDSILDRGRAKQRISWWEIRH